MTRIGHSVWCSGIQSEELESHGFEYLENRLRNPCFIINLEELKTFLMIYIQRRLLKFYPFYITCVKLRNLILL